jgi:molybdopterin-guanine dinucleotide biosynthesis protein A
MSTPPVWTAIVLSGGRSSRLGFDKSGATVAGRTLIDLVASAVPAEISCIVVGPEPVAPPRPISVTREQPPGGGPVAGIAAGLTLVSTPLVGIVAVDMPLAAALLGGLVDRLSDSPDEVDAVIATDDDGRDQPLIGAFRAGALRGAIARLGNPVGRSMRSLVAELSIVRTPQSSDRLRDVDTEDDLELLRRSVQSARRATRGPGMDEWVAAATKALGLEQNVDIDLILDLARDAAHGVGRRLPSPPSCWAARSRVARTRRSPPPG